MNARTRRGNRQPPRGFALILVLWFLVLIAAIGTYLMANARTETAIARNVLSAAAAEALADGGVAEGVFNLTDMVVSRRWPLDGVPHRLALDGGEIIIRLSDENAKINPNRASDALLTALFEATGVERARARRLGAAIADWVSANAQPRPLGAKLEQYRQAGLSYGPPNAPVESLDELQLVLGMTPDVFAAVRPALTIFTEVAVPVAKTASPLIRRALLLAAREPLPKSSATDNSNENDSSVDDPDAPPAGNTGAPSADDEEPRPVIGVDVTALTRDGGVFVRHAVVKLDPEQAKGYATYEWRRGELAE